MTNTEYLYHWMEDHADDFTITPERTKLTAVPVRLGEDRSWVVQLEYGCVVHRAACSNTLTAALNDLGAALR